MFYGATLKQVIRLNNSTTEQKVGIPMSQSELSSMIKRYQDAQFTVAKQAQTELRNYLREELTQEQFAILRYIRNNAWCTSTELSEVFHVRKSAITSIITKLVNKSLLQRLPDPKDRRIIRLQLTEGGTRKSVVTDQHLEKWLASYLAFFQADEIESFILSFEKLAMLITTKEI